MDRRRWLCGSLLLAVLLCVCSGSSCARGGRAPGGGTGGVDGLVFELAAFVPWSDEGLPEEHAAPDGSPGGGRSIPELLLAADGSLCLSRPGRFRVVCVADAEPGKFLELDEAQVDVVASVGATQDGGLVFFGRVADEGVLARLSGSGELLWRRDDLPPAQANCARGQLAVDLDGSVYLFTADRRAWEGGVGEVVRVDLENGALTQIIGYDEKPPRTVWVREGVLYRVLYDEETRYWVSHDLETGQEHAIVAGGDLRSSLTLAVGPVSGGGALIGDLLNDALIWMGTDGEEVDRVELVGAVRAGEGVAAGVREGGMLTLARWVDGELTDSVEIEEPDEFVDLVYVDGDDYYLWGRETGIIAVNAVGRTRVVTRDPSEVTRLVKRGGGVAVTQVAVAEDGSVLLAGADSDGAFIVRLTRR